MVFGAIIAALALVILTVLGAVSVLLAYLATVGIYFVAVGAIVFLIGSAAESHELHQIRPINETEALLRDELAKESNKESKQPGP